METVDSGAACLGMVLAHHGRFERLSRLRLLCDVSRDATTLDDIARAADEVGLEVERVQCTAEELARQGAEPKAFPIIAFWQFRHFVVVEGPRKGGAWSINDPATGRRQVSGKEFAAAFTGVGLRLWPTAAFVPEGRPPSVSRAVLAHAGNIRGQLWFLALLAVGLVAPTLLIPMLLAGFVDGYLDRGIENILPLVVGGLVALVAFSWFTMHLQQRLAARIGVVYGLTLATALVDHLLWLPGKFFSQRAANELVARADLPTHVSFLLAGAISQTALGLLSAALGLAALLFLDLMLAGLVLISAAAVVLVMVLSGRSQRHLSHREGQALSDIAVTAGSSLAVIESVKVSAQESAISDRLSANAAALTVIRDRQESRIAWQAAVPVAILAISQALILVVSASRVISGTFTAGGMVATQMLAQTILIPVAALVTLAIDIARLTDALDRIEDVFDEQAQPHGREHEVTAGPHLTATVATLELPTSVEFRNVTFGYRRADPPLISELSFTVPAGTRTALIGPSGSGKSTVAWLLAGLYEPWSGEILLDGKPRRQWSIESLAAGVGMVTQDVSLFEGTVLDNVRLWDASVTEEQVIGSLHDAAIWREIAARRGGALSTIGEGGRGLSGGQRQRLGIARALVKDPPILIMDEATSALDPVTEQAIEARIRNRGAAVVTIAHRLSTVRDADEIIALDRGRIVERGRHEELLALGGIYARMATS